MLLWPLRWPVSSVWFSDDFGTLAPSQLGGAETLRSGVIKTWPPNFMITVR
jgi:hypothetical protein